MYVKRDAREGSWEREIGKLNNAQVIKQAGCSERWRVIGFKYKRDEFPLSLLLPPRSTHHEG